MLEQASVFRVDESTDIGKGHFSRCTTMAAHLIALDIPCLFICQYISEGSKARLQQLKIDCCEIDTSNPTTEISDAYKSWEIIQHYVFAKNILLVVDSYRLGFVWESFLYDKVTRLCVIDDLNGRMHKCHMAIDQTYGVTQEQIKKLLPVTQLHCLGSQYALVGKDFAELREFSLARRKDKKTKAENILITMGGSDPVNATSLVLDALQRYERGKKLKITVIVGELCPHLEIIQQRVAGMNVSAIDVLINVSPKKMAQLMAACDICISAAGSTMWELATLGVPTLAMQTADNQQKVLDNLSAEWSVYSLGKFQSLTPVRLCEMLLDILNGKINLHDLARKIAKVADGKGVERVVETLLSGRLR
ncbi:UDP-N-acetylglucosamine--N-acetylmuramyl-(pentapeptide) pyrophosphoryl-undecaprenol N-acetylglucosamine transferase [Thalassocella blandensis]|nr:UDP-N-acetylglucosamine--N-acetylmuramyl-(pentapeptide) pyrophosphoryl-undecaprenol N-acetylglucosamine transferase [Thalassocella blandensis]